MSKFYNKEEGIGLCWFVLFYSYPNIPLNILNIPCYLFYNDMRCVKLFVYNFNLLCSKMLCLVCSILFLSQHPSKHP